MSETINSIYTSELANGQVWIGDTGNTPVAANLTAGPNINITNGPGSIMVGATGLGSLTWVTGAPPGNLLQPFTGYVITAGAPFTLSFTLS